ncbi:MAG: epoxyqueuosine reductase QueH [Oscillospiraceae bacterium]|nr:epoxyqueuosine reductase QueH [Oscillospiraceae bacterium]
MDPKKLLLHICCAPCSVYCIASLRNEGIEPVGFWYNPNIHPVTEYKKRKNTLVDYAKAIDLKLVIQNEYGLREFIKGVYPDFDNRCGYCYRVRMDAAAKYAAENGFECFTTTLLVSPYQNHELIRKTGEMCALKYGIKFVYYDFSTGFREGQDKARELGMYMQKYCGCIFSEEDRYTKKKKKQKASEE